MYVIKDLNFLKLYLPAGVFDLIRFIIFKNDFSKANKRKDKQVNSNNNTSICFFIIKGLSCILKCSRLLKLYLFNKQFKLNIITPVE